MNHIKLTIKPIWALFGLCILIYSDRIHKTEVHTYCVPRSRFGKVGWVGWGHVCISSVVFPI